MLLGRPLCRQCGPSAGWKPHHQLNLKAWLEAAAVKANLYWLLHAAAALARAQHVQQ